MRHAFLCGRRRRDFVAGTGPEEPAEAIQSALLESQDGLVWRTAGLFAAEFGDETAFAFEDDGRVVALVRGGGPAPARVCRARPPYADWQRVDLGRNVGGPLLARWGRHWLVGGRRTLPRAPPVTALAWLDEDALVEQLALPSGGDTSYPGFVALDDERGLLSYYSSHEGSGTGRAPCHVYVAQLRLA